MYSKELKSVVVSCDRDVNTYKNAKRYDMLFTHQPRFKQCVVEEAIVD